MKLPVLLLAIGAALNTPYSLASDVTSYVVGGEPVVATDDQNWMASIRLTQADTSHICGGSLINKDWVLTAAHCLVHSGDKGFFVLAPNQLNVMIGSKSVDVEDTSNLYAITHVVVHPAYSPVPTVKVTSQTDGSVVTEVLSLALDNDIALLRLEQSVPEYKATPIQLTNGLMADELDRRLADEWEDSKRPKNTKVSGWGSIKPDGTGIAERLMEAELAYLPIDECFERLELGNQAHYIIDSPLNRTKICTMPPEALFDDEGKPLGHGADSCKGDSGGPLRAKDANGNWLQLGIVSGGPAGTPVCGSYSRPGFYTRVGTYFEWIEQNVGKIPDQIITEPDFIVDQNNDSSTGGGSDSGTGGTPGGKDEEITGECNPSVEGISPSNCNISSGGGGTASWGALFSLLVVAGWRRFRHR
ncbi:serine protease [Photobacterium ganghwense]|uniref:Peptidase S1 domain-containing protein n=1 Tax=Photobacterium ganghwense TaxID=320778 RepID=A0A0J1H8L5_9GAMM|nr:serine protease [Photobacterium ganghwense]KLV08053.1 hypothetical protein ABT57_14590 [Photobacterium ganghwense]PSU07171.1 serine protease [Photobacterium ganghwense]QSV15923.1 serine protease [Photobacterium ganghwense]